MPVQNKTPRDRRAGKTFLHVEIDPVLRNDLRLAAQAEGKALKDWLPEFIRRHVPKMQIVPQ